MFIDLSQIFDENVTIYAHIRENGERETLKEHIDTCEKYFKILCREKEIEKVIDKFCGTVCFEHSQQASKLLKEFVYELFLFHDLGKCNPQFQRKKMKNDNYIEKTFDGVSGANHSFLSAIFYLDYFYGRIEAEHMLKKDEKRKLHSLLLEHSFVIARHHSNFQDFFQYWDSLKNDDVKHLLTSLQEGKIEIYKPYGKSDCNALGSVIRNYRKVKKKNSNRENFMEYFYYRFLYSLLVSCDYYATSEAVGGLKKDSFGSFHNIDSYKEAYASSDLVISIRQFEQNAKKITDKDLKRTTEINELRSYMFLEAERELREHPQEQIYFLEAPTGSGKSNMALNLSFHLMKEKSKLFYIYPFNTLVEQNRESLEQLFSKDKLQGDMAVVNSITPMKGAENGETDSREYYQKILLDRQFLNYPMVLSTHVSFFNILFGCNKEDLFGFLQLTDAVVVLDEIQSYKNSIWAEMIIMLKACANLMGTRIIIMSATLPNLEVLGGKECKVQYLFENSEKYFRNHLFCDRVEISYELLDRPFSLDVLLDFLEENKNYSTGKKVLIEFISKGTAEKFYELLCSSAEISVPVYCLTGDHSIYERNKILKPIKDNMIKECILVATQIIEAGVDIDMDIGYKDISKLDSEEQFLGRINRSFRNNGKVFFFDLDNQEKIYGNDYRVNENLTLNNHEMRELLEQKNFSEYYNKVLKLIKSERNDNTGEIGIDEFCEQVRRLDYKEIENRMKLIEDNDWRMDVFLSRILELEDGSLLNGQEVWDEYKELLIKDMDYAEKQVKLSEVKCRMNYFIYSVKQNPNLSYSDIIGELRFIEDGGRYFINGVLNRELLNSDDIFFGD